MYSDYSYYGLPPATSDLGHVPWQGTTVNPADLLLAQPSHGPTQFRGIPPNVVSTDYNFVGYPAVDSTPQGAPRCQPPVHLSQPMDHILGQFSVINNVPAGHFTGPLTPVGRMPQGRSIRCQWISDDLSICGRVITERDVPKHLAEHGIRGMHKDRFVQCCWRECGILIKRQSITRHFREVHLGLKRMPHRHVFPRDGL